METAKCYFMEGQTWSFLRYSYMCTCSTEKIKQSSAMGFKWVSSETLTIFISWGFVIIFLMECRLTDVAGFEMRDHRKHMRTRNKIKEMQVNEKTPTNELIDYLNIHLLLLLMKHFPVWGYKYIVFDASICTKVCTWELKFSTVYIRAKIPNICNFWNINAHCLVCILHASCEILQSSSGIC